MNLPLFPLNSVIFPGGVLPLRIFESRYLDMVKDCSRHETEFVICLIKDGSEVGAAARHLSIGTACRIVDWETLPDGLLGVTAQGQSRVEIRSTQVQDNQLLMGEVDYLQEDTDEVLPQKFEEWANLISVIIQELGEPFNKQIQNPQSAHWVAARLTEYLPFELDQKQRILEIDHPLVRLENLSDALKDIEYYYSQGNFNN
ncbi:MAG: LON peptidase substrate-binding domain-containing protein [Gammaproteobacteria bacterium]|nr:LON peptidase substrate-binding domain-containing protein [Gammaproteobacteria bacterium]